MTLLAHISDLHLDGSARAAGRVRLVMASMMKRPGMYGGGVAAETVMAALSFVDGFDDLWIRVFDDTMRVPSAFVAEHLPDPDADLYHAMFLPELHRRGWFRSDRLLTSAEHEDLLAALPRWSGEDHAQTDVAESFGAPSWARGGWQGSLAVLVYAAADPAEPMVFFTAVEDAGVVAAWTADRQFPAGLQITPRGKDYLAERGTGATRPGAGPDGRKAGRPPRATPN